MNRLLLATLVGLSSFAFAGHAAPTAKAAGQCGLPTTKPLWIDFADGSVPFWQTFARPGTVAAAANFIYPPRLRAAGAKTVYWDMYLTTRRTGTPTNPADPAEVVERAHRLFDYAAASSACPTPWMAENELFGANLPTPWAPANAQYRANVLLFLRTMASRGARPFLLVSSAPYTVGEAGDWWRQVAQVADIVREVYFPATTIHRQGPILGSRTLRRAFRRAIIDFLTIGIPPTKLGLMLGFQTSPGTGGREGLKPAQAWFDTVKWQALAARQVGRELKFATIWSWGWANWGERGVDPDKPAAACVYLWTRDPTLCDAPKVAGPGFDASLTEGQLTLPRGVKCLVDGRFVRSGDIASLTRVTGDREAAYTALYARAVASAEIPVPTSRALAAERLLISSRFGGSAAAYRAALARAGASLAIGRGALADEVRRAQMKRRFRPPAATATQIADYQLIYRNTLARQVEVTPAAPWLGGKKRGLALATVAPPRVFSAAAGARVTIQTLDGPFKVRVLGTPQPLGLIPAAGARTGIAVALDDLARTNAFESWSVARQRAAIKRTICTRDELPEVADGDLSAYLPFLSLT